MEASPVLVQDQVLLRSYAVEPIVALAASLDGTHCAGGGQSGTVYLWEVPSGRLLRSWPAHYKVFFSFTFPVITVSSAANHHTWSTMAACMTDHVTPVLTSQTAAECRPGSNLKGRQTGLHIKMEDAMQGSNGQLVKYHLNDS